MLGATVRLLIHPKGRGWGVALLSSFFWIRAALHFRGTACWSLVASGNCYYGVLQCGSGPQRNRNRLESQKFRIQGLKQVGQKD